MAMPDATVADEMPPRADEVMTDGAAVAAPIEETTAADDMEDTDEPAAVSPVAEEEPA